MQWLFLILGALSGGAQIHLVDRMGAKPLGLLLRLSMVAIVLFTAARSGHLSFAVAGWALGFGSMLLVRSR